MREKIIKHIFSLSVLFSLAGGTILGIYGEFNSSYTDVGALFFSNIAITFILIYPIVLTFLNLFFLLKRKLDVQLIRKGKHIEYITLGLGSVFSLILVSFTEITLYDWTETLINSQKHTPIWSGGMITIAVLSVLGIGEYFLLISDYFAKVTYKMGNQDMVKERN